MYFSSCTLYAQGYGELVGFVGRIKTEHSVCSRTDTVCLLSGMGSHLFRQTLIVAQNWTQVGKLPVWGISAFAANLGLLIARSGRFRYIAFIDKILSMCSI